MFSSPMILAFAAKYWGRQHHLPTAQNQPLPLACYLLW